jgi:hypothetical protein
MRKVLVILGVMMQPHLCLADDATPLPQFDVDQICATSNQFRIQGGVRKCILQEQHSYDQLKNADAASDGMPYSWDTTPEDVKQSCINWINEMRARSVVFRDQPYSFLKSCVIQRMTALLPKTDLPDVHFHP